MMKRKKKKMMMSVDATIFVEGYLFN